MRRSAHCPPSRSASVLRGVLAAMAVATVGALPACAPIANVAFDPRADFARYRTWDFAPGDHLRVEAPGENADWLEGRVTQLIGHTLRDRGYPRGAERPDLHVGYTLALEPRREVVAVPRAPYLLSSMSDAPSYWVGGTETEERFFTELRLVIEIAEAGGPVVWKGGVRRRVEADQQPDLASAVAWLLERFPRARPATDAPVSGQLALRN